ncbi:ankyrin repeat domain-containing protein [bacterium]|nr:MAG: ankyrin repeat domain-containing protein [bacterium]
MNLNSGHLDAVKYLIENGAYIDAKDWLGQTPLHFASKWGNWK